MMLRPWALDQIERAIGVGVTRVYEGWAAAREGRRAVYSRAGGGWTAVADRASFLSGSWGFGCFGMPTGEDLDEIEGVFDSVGQAAVIECGMQADQAALGLLRERGYVLKHTEVMLVRGLDGDLPKVPGVDGLRVRVIGRGDDALEAWALREASWFCDHEAPEAGGPEPVAEELNASRVLLEAEGALTVVAELDGEAAGISRLFFDPVSLTREDGEPDLVALIGASVRPCFRRRGIQSVLLRERLRIGRERAMRHARVGGYPAGPTERNALRAGFGIGCYRLAFTRPSG